MANLMEKNRAENKKTMALSIICGTISIIAVCALVALASFLKLPAFARTLLIVAALLIAIVGIGAAAMLEIRAGYFECPHCKARMEALAERLDIKNALPNLISECSHGMKQKIAVIGALIHEPKLILMDEPFVGLDPIAAHELKEIMAEHCRNGGAIFFSTHVLEVAEKLCDNVAIIKNGKLIAHGTMDSVRGDGSLEQVFLELEDHKD